MSYNPLNPNGATTAANSSPVAIATDQLSTLATEANQDTANASLSSIDSKLTPITEIPADDVDSDAIPVRALPTRTSRISFTNAISNGVDSAWGTTLVTGSGMTVNQTGGNLVITAGTTTRSETIIRSNESWKGGLRLAARSTLSQRNTNNSFFVELVIVS